MWWLALKADFFFRRNGRVHLNRRRDKFSRLLVAETCASAVVMLDTPCSEVVWRVLATQFILQLPLHFPYRASPYAITFQLDSTTLYIQQLVCVMLLYWLAVGRILPRANQHKHMTIPIAVYTELILLMMSSKPARNM